MRFSQLALVTLAGASSLLAQGSCTTWYVEPVRGLNTGTGLSPFDPFATLTFALAQADLSVGRDVVVLLPGEYNSTNEAYPLEVPANVSIRGTSALNTVLRLTSGGGPILRFAPKGIDDHDQTVVDAVSFVGPFCVQILEGVNDDDLAIRSNPTFSNSFFIDGAPWSVDIVVTGSNPPFDDHDLDGNGLIEHRPKFLNCTFAAHFIGINNRTVPGSDGSIGESEPGLLNCLFSDASGSDLHGVDSLDVQSSAFATVDATMFLGAGFIKPPGVAPTPVFNTTVNPPQYIETNLGPAITPFDLRVRPTSPAIDVGSRPPTLAWANGTTGQSTFSCGANSTIDVFDTDCEGYGNRRLERNGIDIGADESGELIIFGYRTGTTTFRFPDAIEVFVNPFPSFVGGFDAVFGISTAQSIPLVEWLEVANPTEQVRALQTIEPFALPPLGTLLIDTSAPGYLTGTLPVANPNVSFVLGSAPVTANEFVFNYQVVPVQTPILRTLTNLQSTFLRP